MRKAILTLFTVALLAGASVGHAFAQGGGGEVPAAMELVRAALLARVELAAQQVLVEQPEQERVRAAVVSAIPTCKVGTCAAFTVRRPAVACSAANLQHENKALGPSGAAL
jgi:hypothetical protein